jgi:cell wall-associated NlpC family hydrolase
MIGLAVAFFAVTLPNAAVLAPVANMYSAPAQDSPVVSQAIYGANVAVIEQREGWAHVHTADDYAGWIPLAQLRPGPVYAAPNTNRRVAQVQSLFAHIYREPSVTAHAPLLTVPFETRLEVAPVEVMPDSAAPASATSASAAPEKASPPAATPDAPSEWLKLYLVDGATGWVQSGDVAFDVKPISLTEMLALSKRFLGFPYTWGGTSSYGYDCSGFIQMLERRRGLSLPRDAQPQADWSGVEPVERDHLQPGDLLYFGSSSTHITHTGLYLGDNKFISATAYQTPMVRIDDVTDPHWSPLLVATRRVK